MYKGAYIALTGATPKQTQMDLISHNIANVNTAGYKKDRIAFKEYLTTAVDASVPQEPMALGENYYVATDFSSGPIVKTGNPLDIAIDGEGFFALEGNKYTRGGNFRISADGFLVTQNNTKVLTDGGPISIEGEHIEILSTGEIFVNNESAGILKVVNFKDQSVLKRFEGSIFISDKAGEESTSHVMQGYIESSNVDAIREMVNMMTALREFESFQKIIRTFDEASSKVVNEMGR
jgi:flagellar basal-body rod protein FlgG